MVLSPAAQAVRDAYKKGGLDAALRAAADQVVPLELCLPEQAPMEGHIRQDQRSKIRRKLLALATELDPTP
jgi:hypothetical protein